jgi:hypothetical protein
MGNYKNLSSNSDRTFVFKSTKKVAGGVNLFDYVFEIVQTIIS